MLSLLGIGTAMAFHAYRAYRSVFNPKKFRYHFLDTIVALATLGAVGAAVYAINWGEIRLYVPMSLAGGFLAANALVGDLVYKYARSAFQKVLRGMRWTKTRVIDPPKYAVKQALQKARDEFAKIAAPSPEPPSDVEGPSPEPPPEPTEPPKEPPSEST